MGRSGYDDCIDDNWAVIKYRGQVASAIRGKRGQQFLRDLIAALDALPEKKLIAGELEHEGCVCAIGSVGHLRGVDLAPLDPEDAPNVAASFNIAEPLAREIVWENDEGGHWKETPERRWQRMRDWAERNLARTNQEAS